MTILEKKQMKAAEEKKINYIGVFIGILIYGSLSIYLMFQYVSK